MQKTRRLVRIASDVSAYGVAAVIKCGVCLGLLALLALIAASISDSDAGVSIATSAVQEKASAHVGDRAAASRKLVFDERRRRSSH